MGSQGVPLEMSCRCSTTLLTGKCRSALLGVSQVRQHGSGNLLGCRGDFIEVVLKTLLDDPEPIGFEAV